MMLLHILIGVFIIVVPISVLISSCIGSNRKFTELTNETGKLKEQISQLTGELLRSGLIERDDGNWDRKYKNTISVRSLPLLLDHLNLILVETQPTTKRTLRLAKNPLLKREITKMPVNIEKEGY